MLQFRRHWRGRRGPRRSERRPRALSRRPFGVVVCEARGRVGGRTASIDELAGAQPRRRRAVAGARSRAPQCGAAARVRGLATFPTFPAVARFSSSAARGSNLRGFDPLAAVHQPATTSSGALAHGVGRGAGADRGAADRRGRAPARRALGRGLEAAADVVAAHPRRVRRRLPGRLRRRARGGVGTPFPGLLQRRRRLPQAGRGREAAP